MGNAYVIVIDGLGVGAQEDAHQYGDEDMDTLGHVSRDTGVKLPNLQKMGLGNIIPLDSVAPNPKPLAAWGKLKEVSAGKDSTTGHWEIAGVQLEKPFPTYPCHTNTGKEYDKGDDRTPTKPFFCGLVNYYSFHIDYAVCTLFSCSHYSSNKSRLE